MKIPFTQFLLPDGRRREVTFDCDSKYDKKVQSILDSGATFECEILGMGNVSLTVEFENPNGEHVTLAHELSENSPEIVGKTETLIINAYQKLNDMELNNVM
jgi:hypothetical protein